MHLGKIKYGDPKHVHAITDTQSGAHFTYDLVGQMKTSNTLNFAWTDEQQLGQIGGAAHASFAYNSQRRRVKADFGGQKTLTPDPLLDIDPTGASMSWIFAEGRRVARTASGTTAFLHSDTLGSTRLVTDQTGATVAEYDYVPWGRDTAITNVKPTQYRFAGGESDGSMGLTMAANTGSKAAATRSWKYTWSNRRTAPCASLSRESGSPTSSPPEEIRTPEPQI